MAAADPPWLNMLVLDIGCPLGPMDTRGPTCWLPLGARGAGVCPSPPPLSILIYTNSTGTALQRRLKAPSESCAFAEKIAQPPYHGR